MGCKCLSELCTYNCWKVEIQGIIYPSVSLRGATEKLVFLPLVRMPIIDYP